MTEKQEEVKSKLVTLIKKSSVKNLSINFISQDEGGLRGVPSKVRKDSDVVVLSLVDPGLDDSKLQEWNAAIDQATALIDLIEAEKFHEQNSPNFFTAVRAIAKDHQKISYIM